jgi:hypothetical protein
MAENKPSFLLYRDIMPMVKKLPNDKAGELFKLILSYVNDENPDLESIDFVLQIAFEPIKQSLKRDLKKYKNIVERNKINGLKGGRPKKPKKPTGLNGNPKKPKKADNDIDSGIDKEEYIQEKPVYIYNQFYDEQLKLSNNDPKYKMFIEILFGKNLLDRKLNTVLAMKEQVSFNQMKSVDKIKNDSGKLISELLVDMETWLMKNTKSKNTTVLGTLRTFAKNKK